MLLPSFVMEGRVIKHSGGVEAQHRHCQQLIVKRRGQRVRGQADLVGGDSWSKDCFLLCCEVNVTPFTPRSSGTLAAKPPADLGEGGARLRLARHCCGVWRAQCQGSQGSPLGALRVSPARAGSALR